jgi:hypothetical protein
MNVQDEDHELSFSRGERRAPARAVRQGHENGRSEFLFWSRCLVSGLTSMVMASLDTL